jgi:GDPmannose 4,6-dehydratase
LGLLVYIGYLFHHESPRRKPEQISRQIAAAAAGRKRGSVLIGNWNVRKEWAFAGDIVEGIWTLVSQTRVMEACIGTGKAFSIEEWAKACFSISGGSWRAKVLRRRGKFVPEYEMLVSSPRKIFALGWRPKTTFSELAALMVRSEKVKKLR